MTTNADCPQSCHFCANEAHVVSIVVIVLIGNDAVTPRGHRLLVNMLVI